MPAVTLSATPKLAFFTATGLPLVGGKLFTFLAGTSTPSATYTDSTGTIANANPIILDSRGEANVWLVQNQAYKFTLQDSLGNLIYTVDNVNYAGPSGISQTFANGSAAAPSVNFTQALTSGLYSPAVNSVGISTNGVSAVIVDASQNVGIGGTPTTKLDVFGTARFGGAVSITAGGLNVVGGLVLPSGNLTLSAGGVTATGTSVFTGTTAFVGATSVSGGIFTTRGFVDNATAAAYNIDASGRLLNNGNAQPTFNARRTSSQTSGGTLIFDTAGTNYGANYNAATGVFTAPVAGIYAFAANAEISNTGGSGISFTVQIQGSGVNAFAASSYVLPAGSLVDLNVAAAAIALSAGETVTVTINVALTSTFLLAGSVLSRFSGRLLG